MALRQPRTPIQIEPLGNPGLEHILGLLSERVQDLGLEMDLAADGNNGNLATAQSNKTTAPPPPDTGKSRLTNAQIGQSAKSTDALRTAPKTGFPTVVNNSGGDVAAGFLFGYDANDEYKLRLASAAKTDPIEAAILSIGGAARRLEVPFATDGARWVKYQEVDALGTAITYQQGEIAFLSVLKAGEILNVKDPQQKWQKIGRILAVDPGTKMALVALRIENVMEDLM